MARHRAHGRYRHSLPGNKRRGHLYGDGPQIPRGGGAFTDSSVESLTLPETITDIDEAALTECPSLARIQISSHNGSFASFDDMLFSKDYSHLLLVPEGKEGAAHIPDQTNFVPALGISRCPGLLTVEVGEGGAAFSSYNAQLFSKDMKTLVAAPAGIGTSVVLPAEVETIGEYALAGCKDLTSITALGSVREIDASAFADEVKASAVVALPGGKDFDERKAVWEEAGFQHFAEPAEPGVIVGPEAGGSNADSGSDAEAAASGFVFTLLDDYTLSVGWEGAEDPAAEVEIPASAEINGVSYRVSTIAANAFANRGTLEKVTLPATVTSLGEAAFAGCANLTTIQLPDTLRELGERAFEATALTDVWLPASVQSIGSRAFASCESLTRIVALGTPQVADDTLAGCANLSLYCPYNADNTYPWNLGLIANNNHLNPYGLTLPQEPLTLEVGQQANLFENALYEVPDPCNLTYSYAAAPVSVEGKAVIGKKKGSSEVTAVLSLDGVVLARSSRTVEVVPGADALEEDGSDVSMINETVAILPSAYLAGARTAASKQLSVAAPLAVNFGGMSGYDMAKPASSVTSTGSFQNNSRSKVYMTGLTCTANGVETILEANSGSLDTQQLFSLYPGTNSSKAVNFGYGNKVNSVTPANDAFIIDADSSLPCTFRLNLANAKVKEGLSDNGASVQSLANVTCMFELAPGQGTENDDFYLKDKTTGLVYSTSEVADHADAIAAGDTDVKAMYEAFMADETKYECKTTWGGVQYDVRIIGINHDELAKPEGDRTKAGLTFQFKECLAGNDEDYWGQRFGYRFNADNRADGYGYSEGGWGASELRARMNPGKDSPKYGNDDNAIWDLVPKDLQDVIAPVNKRYASSYTKDAKVTTSSDSLFIASYSELVPSIWASDFPWTADEGLQYEYWHGKAYNGNNTCLIKHNVSPSASAIYWWERSVLPDFSMGFLQVNPYGSPTNSEYPNRSYGVCPCFCL